MEVLQFPAIRLDHLFREESLEATKQTLVQLLGHIFIQLHLNLLVDGIIFLLLLILLFYHFHLSVQSENVLG